MRQLKLRAQRGVTLKTSLGRFSRINNRVRCAAALYVQASRPVTRFTAHALCVFTFCLQTRVRCRSKIARFVFVAGRAFFTPNKFRSRNIWWRENSAICFKRGARKQNDGQRGCSSDCPQQFLAFTVQPSGWPQDSHAPALLTEMQKIDYAFIRKKLIVSKLGEFWHQRRFRFERVARYSVGDFPENLLKTRLNCESD